jgi:hypothetical protein
MLSMPWLFSIVLAPFFVFAVPLQSDGFQAANRLFQEQKFAEAYSQYEAEYKNGQNFAALLYNWGLAAYKLDKKGFAIAAWRRALFLDPELSRAHEALAFAASELPRNPFSSESSFGSSIRRHILERADADKFLGVTWILFITSGFILIRYFGERKTALREEKPLPQLPHIGSLLAVLFTASVVLTTAKIITLYETRATVTADRTALRTGPSGDDNVIVDLVVGMDVVVKQVQETWAQVVISADVSGWVPTEAIFQHTGKKNLW